jgi:hypothetical protein
MQKCFANSTQFLGHFRANLSILLSFLELSNRIYPFYRVSRTFPNEFGSSTEFLGHFQMILAVLPSFSDISRRFCQFYSVSRSFPNEFVSSTEFLGTCTDVLPKNNFQFSILHFQLKCYLCKLDN